MDFCNEINKYIVLRLFLVNYKQSKRQLAKEYEVKGGEIRNEVRTKEQLLLKKYFKNWSIPYEGKLKGWSEDSPTYITYNNNLVAGVYFCDKNEFDDNNLWGQVHYAFIDPQFKGKGLYSVLFREVVDKAKKMNLEGLYLNSDRHILPEVYIKWGAKPWKKIKKRKSNRIVSYLKKYLRNINQVIGTIT